MSHGDFIHPERLTLDRREHEDAQRIIAEEAEFHGVGGGAGMRDDDTGKS